MTHLRAWVCSVCKLTSAEIPRHHRLEARLEYRRLSDQGREKVVKLYDICLSCMKRQHASEVPNKDQEVFFP